MTTDNDRLKMTRPRLKRLLAVLNTYLAVRLAGQDADAWLDSVPDEYGDHVGQLVKAVAAKDRVLDMDEAERADAIKAEWREWADVQRRMERRDRARAELRAEREVNQ
jgi:hypothetical protein